MFITSTVGSELILWSLSLSRLQPGSYISVILAKRHMELSWFFLGFHSAYWGTRQRGDSSHTQAQTHTHTCSHTHTLIIMYSQTLAHTSTRTRVCSHTQNICRRTQTHTDTHRNTQKHTDRARGSTRVIFRSFFYTSYKSTHFASLFLWHMPSSFLSLLVCCWQWNVPPGSIIQKTIHSPET